MNEKRQKSIGIGLGLGVAIGVAMGAAWDNIGMGIALGIALGVAFGSSGVFAGRGKGDSSEPEPSETRDPPQN